MPEAAPKKKLRTGFTTGSCATAATQAALQALLTQQQVKTVEVELPAGDRVTFQIAECTIRNGEVMCGVVKVKRGNLTLAVAEWRGQSRPVANHGDVHQ